MSAYSLKYAKENLEQIAEQTVDDADATVITLDSGRAIVMIPLEQYESWKETQYLMSSRANRERLLKSIEQSRTGNVVQRELIEP